MSQDDEKTGYGVHINMEDVYQASFRRTVSATGVVLAVALFVVGLAGEVARQSGDAYTLGPLGVFVESGPFDFDLALPVVLLLSLSAQVGTVVVGVYAYRAFADGTPELGTRYEFSFGKASVSAFLASAAFVVLVSVGLLLLVVPGVYLTVALAFYLIFAAVEDDGPVEALRSSWLLTKGRRNSVFILLVVFLFFAFGVVFLGFLISTEMSSFVAGHHTDYAAEVSEVLVTELFQAALTVFLLAVLFEAYLQLREDSQTP